MKNTTDEDLDARYFASAPVPGGEIVLRQTTSRREIPGGVASSSEDLLQIANSSFYQILERDYHDGRMLLNQYGLESVTSSSMIETISDRERWHVYVSGRGTSVIIHSPKNSSDVVRIQGLEIYCEQTARDMRTLAESQGLKLRQESQLGQPEVGGEKA